MRKKFLLFVNILIAGWLVVAMLSMQVPPQEFWPAGFVALSMPLALVSNLFLMLLWLWHKPVFALIPLLLIFAFEEPYQRLFAFNLNNKTVAESAETVQVLSYNVRVFNKYGHLRDPDYRSSLDMLDWIAQSPAGIICLQEFYHEKDSDIFNSVSRIGTRHDREAYVVPALINHIGAEFGLAIFSEYPIVNKGEITFKGKTNNQAIFADVLVGDDTLRVYNFHLQSMSIEEKDIADVAKEEGLFRQKSRYLARRLRSGFISRGEQVNLILEHVAACPYPVILAGDLNDLPFSYTYQQLAENFENAFEKSGFGIGTTYNGIIPFLRIDNQFYSSEIKNINYRVFDEIGYSDHFPSLSTYILPRTPNK